MKKRTVAFVLVLVLCLSLLSVTALADGAELTRAELAELVYNKFRPTASGEGLTFTDIDGCTQAQQTAIKALAAAGILSGNSDGTFDPNGIATRGMSALIIWRMTNGNIAAEVQTIFDDVAGTPYETPIDFLVTMGVLRSSDAIDGGFEPDMAATAAIVREWLSRLILEGEDTGTDNGGENDGEDVGDSDGNNGGAIGGENAGEGTGGVGGGDGAGGTDDGPDAYDASIWAQEELGRADKLDMIPDSLKGQDLTKDITRAEFAAVCVKAYEALAGVNAEPIAENPFVDCDDTEVLKAYNVGITNGLDGPYYGPDNILSREQMATMLTRVYKRVTISGWTLYTDAQYTLSYTMPAKFADDALISKWAYDSVYFMAANKIINGVEDNKFAPHNATAAEEAIGYANATREQAIVLALRMVENLGE